MNHPSSQSLTRKMVLAALLTAFALISTLLLRFDFAGFLTYDPKDVFLALIGFFVGPLWSMMSSLVVQFLELVLVSKAGPIGFIMGGIASISFCVPAAIVYRKKPSMVGATIGLLLGSILLSANMLILNYFITQLYLQIPREEVVGLFASTIIPFNLVKAAVNTTLILLLHPPVTRALKKANLLPQIETASTKRTVQLLALVVITLLAVMGATFLVLQAR